MNWRPISESYPVEQRQNILLARRNGNEWLFTKVGQFGSDNPEWPVTHWCPITPPAEQQGDRPDEQTAVASLAVLAYQGWKRCSDAAEGKFNGHYSKSLVTADGEFELSFGRKKKPAFSFVETAETLAERDDADDDCSYCGGPMDEPDGQSCSKCIAIVLADATENKPSSSVGLPADLDVSATDQPDLAALIPNDGESMADFLSVDAATKRLKAIRGGANFDEIYAEWSSPASRFQALQADTQRVAYAALEDLADIRRENDRYRAALNKIAKWHGEFPETGHTWDDGTPMSYGAAFGSNGERDFMRKVAADALDGDEAEIEDTTTTPA